MAFEIDHDWQGNLATPRPRIGTAAKTHLLLILCIIWILLGLVGHEPWKPNESTSISIVKAVLQGHYLDPVAVGENTLTNPPLYYLSAAFFAKLFSPFLNMHDAARMVSGLWMALTLLVTGMIGRELWGEGLGRQSTFILLSSVGLVAGAHMLMPEISALTGSAMAFYALALAKRRPFRASALLGLGIGISFLSTGLITALISATSALLLPLFFKAWRSKSYATVLGLAALIATPWLALWPAFMWYQSPEILTLWWQTQTQFNQPHYLSLLRSLSWFAWPGLPIAAWGLWRFREQLLQKPKFQLILTYFLIAFALIGMQSKSADIATLTLLVPLVAIAGGSTETLRRGAAGALNWFGLTLFGLIGLLIWLGWIAITTGYPAKLATRMHVLSGLETLQTSIPALIIAVLISVIWLITISNKRSNRAAVTDWAVGVTMAWSLLMALWLPMIDSAKSYKSVMLSLQKSLPKKFDCINGEGVNKAQQALLDYYTDLRLTPSSEKSCHLMLVQADRSREIESPQGEWQLIWEGKRPADRHEHFSLYKKSK